MRIMAEMTRAETEAQGMEVLSSDDPKMKPDWSRKCQVCDATPIVPLTGLCGPCTFGESETVNGNW
jgi:hypothetical protein